MSATTEAELDLVTLSERYFAAWATRDPDAIVALHTEDTMYWSHAGTDRVIGKEAVRQAFTAVFEQFPEFGFDIHRVLYGPDFWVLDWTLSAVLDGRPTQFDCLDVVVVSPDGLVARKDTYVDPTQLTYRQ